jgi:dUTP pyrophosphatase
MNKLKIYCEDVNCTPTRAHPTDAGLDLKSSETIILHWDKPTLVRTGLHVEIPEGYVGMIFARSGLALKQGITLVNNVGIIDSDYRGEIKCALVYRNPDRCSGCYTIGKYDRIAQLVLVPCFVDVVEFVSNLEDLSNTNRGDGGFGSSG